MSQEQQPHTVEEAIQLMFSWLDLENRKILKAMPKTELWSLHHGYGTGIRNSLGLWNGKNPLLQLAEFKGMFPDDISMILIERLWDYLQTIELDEPKAED